jgi:AraC-like DNA-binding protein
MSDKLTSPLTNRSLPLSRLKLFSPVMHALEDIGIDPNKILEPQGLTVEGVDNPGLFVHAGVMFGLVEAAGAAASIRGFCTAVGENLDLSSWFQNTNFVNDASTTGDLMTRFTSAVSQETTSTYYRLLIEGDRACFSQHRVIVPPFVPAHTDALQIGLWVKILHRALGDGWIASQVVATVSDPAALPEDFHGIKAIKGGRQGFSISFPASWLTATFDRKMFNRCSSNIGRSTLVPSNLVASVRLVLRPHLARQDLNAKRAAELCGFRPSILKRKLAAHHTSIFQELDTMKKEVAIDALLQADRSIGEIAASVGYADPTAFSRAFKRWTGDSPRAYRKNHAPAD